MAFPKVRQFVASYFRRKFAAGPINTDQLISKIENGCNQSIGWHTDFLSKGTVRDLLWFLRRYKEGAFVALSLIKAARGYDDILFDRDQSLTCMREKVKGYPQEYRNVCMADLPRISGVEPVDLLHRVAALNSILWSLKDNDKRLRYYDDSEWRRFDHQITFREELDKEDYRILSVTKFGMRLRNTREDVIWWEKHLEGNWEWFAKEKPEAARVWTRSDALTKEYFMGRACDLVRYGAGVADLSFPEPGKKEHKQCVAVLVWLFKAIEEKMGKLEKKWKEDQAREWVEESCERAGSQVSANLPVNVVERQLSDRERETVLAACEAEIRKSEQARNMMEVIRQLAICCVILGKPENRIMVRSGQMVERTHKTRTVADMSNEMASELIKLPPYTAYARFAKRTGGDEKIVIQKIRTLKPEAIQEGVFEERTRIIERVSAPYYVPRARIEEEIRARQDEWRRLAAPKPPPGQSGEGKLSTEGPVAKALEAGGPPPQEERP